MLPVICVSEVSSFNIDCRKDLHLQIYSHYLSNYTVNRYFSYNIYTIIIGNNNQFRKC